MSAKTDWRTAPIEERHAFEREVWGPWAQKYREDSVLRVEGDLRSYFGEGRHAEDQAILEAMGDLRGMKVLETGCGPGGQIPLFARAGAEVWAFDLVPEVVDVAKRLCRVNGIEDRVHLEACSFEEMPYADAMFDRVVGFGVLHHVNIPLAAKQVHRVLKPGGVGVFAEPLGSNPILEWARKHVPYPGKEEHGTDVPLTEADVAEFAKPFASHVVTPFYLFSMIEQVLGWKLPGDEPKPTDAPLLRRHRSLARVYRSAILGMRRADASLVRKFPGLGRYYRMAVMTFTKS